VRSLAGKKVGSRLCCCRRHRAPLSGQSLLLSSVVMLPPRGQGTLTRGTSPQGKSQAGCADAVGPSAARSGSLAAFPMAGDWASATLMTFRMRWIPAPGPEAVAKHPSLKG
ncbi:unnamed protein product, partial [Prorocentrum cordatum]